MNELKPCPFCGRESTLSNDGAGSYKEACANYVSCPIETAWLSSRKVALRAWNRRAQPDNGDHIRAMSDEELAE